MAGLTELIARIGDENMEFQKLSQSMLCFKSNKKHGDCEVTFATAMENIHNDKEAVIVWVDKEVLRTSLDKIT
jgi:hypothetical protein